MEGAARLERIGVEVCQGPGGLLVGGSEDGALGPSDPFISLGRLFCRPGPLPLGGLRGSVWE